MYVVCIVYCKLWPLYYFEATNNCLPPAVEVAPASYCTLSAAFSTFTCVLVFK